MSESEQQILLLSPETRRMLKEEAQADTYKSMSQVADEVLREGLNARLKARLEVKIREENLAEAVKNARQI
jgi:ribosomal protein S4|tara:strand:- start:321 stop:533 length:213 start_codon:yes stop_codon:yes gene_type:complete